MEEKYNKIGFLKASLRLIYWTAFQAPNKYEEMIEDCVKYIKND